MLVLLGWPPLVPPACGQWCCLRRENPRNCVLLVPCRLLQKQEASTPAITRSQAYIPAPGMPHPPEEPQRSAPGNSPTDLYVRPRVHHFQTHVLPVGAREVLLEQLGAADTGRALDLLQKQTRHSLRVSEGRGGSRADWLLLQGG